MPKQSLADIITTSCYIFADHLLYTHIAAVRKPWPVGQIWPTPLFQVARMAVLKKKKWAQISWIVNERSWRVSLHTLSTLYTKNRWLKSVVESSCNVESSRIVVSFHVNFSRYTHVVACRAWRCHKGKHLPWRSRSIPINLLFSVSGIFAQLVTRCANGDQLMYNKTMLKCALCFSLLKNCGPPNEIISFFGPQFKKFADPPTYCSPPSSVDCCQPIHY